MSIIVGDSTDGVRTGLAGRIANNIAAIFAGITYPSGANHQKGINALVQGFVDAFNNDLVDPATQVGTNPMASATSTAGQTITANSFQIVVYGTVVRDTDSAYNSSTGRFTVPTGKGGDYLVSAGIGWNTALTGESVLSVFKNAAEQVRAEVINPAAAASSTVAGVVNAAAGDILDVRLFQNSVGSVALRSAVAQQVFINIKRIS